MAFIKQLAALMTVLVVSHAQQQNRPGQPQFNCPQPTGQFEYQQDCSKYWQCDGGSAALTDCPSQLIFNSARGFCDWPHNVPNPTCTQVANRNLNPNTANLCQSNPLGGNPQEAFHVGSPDFCNAFFICSRGYIHSPCVFCPDGSYFNTGAGGCREYSRNQDINQLCSGKQMVEHRDKVFKLFESTCWPMGGNPFEGIKPVSTTRGPNPTTFRG